jgi:tetratricopeptide (TPR) repeat protein
VEDHLDAQIRKLREFYWSDADPDGRGFAALADLYRRAGDLSEAGRLLKDGVARHPNLASGHVVFGWVQREQGRAAEAESSFRAALALDQRNLCSLRGLGLLLKEKGEQEEALGVFQELRLLDPNDEEIPIRIRELQEALGALVEEAEGEAEGEGAAGLKATGWRDGEEVAEELDWEVAAVQRDKSKADEDGVEVAPPDEERAEAEQAAEVSAEVEVPGSLADALATRTMGKLYLRQGLLAQAKKVFLRLLGEDPENVGVRSLLEEVEARGRGEKPEKSPGIIIPIQELAPDEPDAVPVASLAPDIIVPIQELAPDGLDVVPVEFLPPEPVFSSGDLKADEIFPLGDLTRDEILPVEVLVPEGVISTGELAPETVVPIGTLAPDLPHDDPRLDDFEAWLENFH